MANGTGNPCASRNRLQDIEVAMDERPKSHLEVLLDNLDTVPDRQGPSLMEQLEEISRRELNVIERKQNKKPRPDFHGLRLIEGGRK